MIKKASLGLVFFCLTNSAAAQWEVTAAYSQLSDDHFDLGAAVLGAGYSFPISERLSITPMVRIGFGVKDDSFLSYTGASQNGQPAQYVTPARLEIDQYYGLQIRGEFQLNNRAYLFVVPSYSDIEFKKSINFQRFGIDLPNYSGSYSLDGFGIGAGAGLRFNDLISAEFSYETTDLGSRVDMDTLNVQLRFSL